jgi:hypothetical protein
MISSAFADTLASYMDIEKQIPQMQLKADLKSHAWARSARKIIVMHDDAVTESINEMNLLAKAKGEEIFCMPSGEKVTAEQIHSLILAYSNKVPAEEQKSISVAKVAILALKERYACRGESSGDGFEQAVNNTSSGFDFEKARARMQSVRG